jgi:hypothetical protein
MGKTGTFATRREFSKGGVGLLNKETVRRGKDSKNRQK